MNKIIKVSFILLLASSICIGSLKGNAQKKETAKELVDGFSKLLDSEQKAAPNKIESTLNEQEHVSSYTNPAYDSIRFFRELKQADFVAYHQERSFTWQYYSGIFIFIMVMIVVGMGLVLSFKQFQLTEKQVQSNIKKPKEEVTPTEDTKTEIEISQTGLKINTGVIGLAILFLSLAFFFLYLKYVYEITILDIGK